MRPWKYDTDEIFSIGSNSNLSLGQEAFAFFPTLLELGLNYSGVVLSDYLLDMWKQV